jgi:TRAP-type C4-dicarboxylate transport system substrate-binding protein
MTRIFLCRKTVLAAGLAMLVGVGLSPTAEAKTIVLRYAAQGAAKGIRATALKWWAAEIGKRTQGGVKIKFFWSGALLKAGDAMEGIGAGTADCGGAWGIYHPAKTPLWTVGDPPFSHDDPYVGLRAMQEMFKTYQPLIRELAKYNVKILAPFVSGMTQLGTSRKPVYVPADTNGMKIRFAGGQWARFWKSCGAVPVKLTQGEVYEGMMRGTVDGTQSYFFILEAYKHWDVLKFYTVINAGEICSYGLAINLDRWRKLPAKVRRIIQQVSDEFVVKYARGLVESRKRIIPLGKKKGMKFLFLTKDQKKQWLKKAQPFLDAWVKFMDKKGLPGQKTQATFLKLAAKYEAEVAKKGYPWGR